MEVRKRFITIAVTGVILLASLLMTADAAAQSFGKNKVQYKEFDWKFVQSKHFDVYYYGGAKPLAEFTADVAESSYVSLKKDFKYEIEKRIPILIYNGHNDFQQTNVTLSDIGESVGGFTEIFKDRVVLPFLGNYEDFRHVIHHELTHAVMFQMFYGGGVGAAVTGMARFQIPLWLAEGLAEYESLGWDTKSDMYMRDASMNGYVPPIEYMSGFMVYKGGQSLLNYIADKYGSEKIGEILGKVRLTRSADNGMKQALGIDIEELSDRWQKYLRKTYWPDIQDRNEPEDVAKQLTDHTKKENFLNGSPALSPKGDRLVFLSDQSDYTDIRLMTTVDGKDRGRVVKGQRSDLFEEMHWLRPGMSWSPDGKQITFAAKAGDADRLYILDVKHKKILRDYKFDLDGVFSPAWSPDGDKIAFMGQKDSQSDIYLLDIQSGKIEKLTDDVFSDMDPAWSPDGKELVFVSDRQDVLGKQPDGYKIQDHDYKQQDIYVLNVAARTMTRLMKTDAGEKSPAFSPNGRSIAYISDASGVDNIYILNRDTGDHYPVTNQLTGISQLSWSRDGSRLIFTAFWDGGYDLYLINNPLDIPQGQIKLADTAFMKKLEEEKKERPEESPVEQPSGKFQNFVFGRNFKEGRIETRDMKKQSFPDSATYKTADGDYKTKKYKIHFSPDMVTGDAGYSQFFGLQGSSQIVLSDILGNHQINLYTDLFYSLKNSNFMFAYYYLPKQTDVGISLFHYSYLYYTYFVYGNEWYYGYLRDRNYGVSLYASRPFSRYRRIDFSATLLAIDRDLEALNPYYYYGYYGYGDYSQHLGSLYKKRTVFFSLGHTTDTVLWGMTGPVNGSRSNLTVTYSPLLSKTHGLSFYSVQADWRKYLRIGRDYTFAMRMTSGFSDGRNPQRFLLGGMSNWLNYSYRSDIYNEFLDKDLFFFSSFEGPLRGTPYYAMIGSRFALANLEFRFPMIRYLILGGPLGIGFQNIRGVAFLDIGSAWNSNRRWKPFTEGPGGFPKLNEARAGYGIGARVNMGFLILRYDLAWPTNLVRTKSTPVHYWSLGADF